MKIWMDGWMGGNKKTVTKAVLNGQGKRSKTKDLQRTKTKDMLVLFEEIKQ